MNFKLFLSVVLLGIVVHGTLCIERDAWFNQYSKIGPNQRVARVLRAGSLDVGYHLEKKAENKVMKVHSPGRNTFGEDSAGHDHIQTGKGDIFDIHGDPRRSF